MIEFKALEAFIRVAQLSSFRGAAKQLNTTQPAISHRVAMLERQLGFPLFLRTARGATLTARGRTVLDHAERLLALRSDMLARVMDPTALRGTVRLGVAETIVHTWLGRFVERMNAAYPQIVLDIEVDTTYRLRAALEANTLDVAFLLGPISGPNLANAALSRYPLGYVARHDIGLPRGRVTLAALARWPIITYQKETIPHNIVQETFARAGLGQVRIFASSSLSTIVRMTSDGIGVSFIPPIIIERERRAGELRVLKPDAPAAALEFTVTWSTTGTSHLAEPVARLARSVAAER
jgi:DNA-binding transcriptional LysR family regulator